MRGLTVVVATADPERAAAALTMACAAAALGGPVRAFFHDAAVALLAGTDADLRALVDTAIEAGVAVVACQTGIAHAGLSAETLPGEAGGMVSLLATLGDDRLVAF